MYLLLSSVQYTNNLFYININMFVRSNYVLLDLNLHLKIITLKIKLFFLVNKYLYF
jgi:hypothetical protein